MLKMRKNTRTSYSITTDDGSEVEVQFEPIDWMDMHAERVGDKLVVAYLSNDNHPSNPMTEFDGQGALYTKPSHYGGGVITDDMGALLDALQLDGENEVRPGTMFLIEGGSETLEDHAVRAFMFENGGCDLAREWINEGRCSKSYEEHELVDEDLYVDWRDDIEADILNGEFKYDEHQALMLTLYAKHWREIVGPFVVPVSWCDNNHGPGTTSASVTSWDGDADDLPDAVWVAGINAEENIVSSCLPAGVSIRWGGALSVEASTLHAIVSKDGVDVHDAGTEGGSWGRALIWAREQYGEPKQSDIVAAAERYAEPVLSEYVDWCNGNVFGCCVETFTKVGEDDDAWESVESDECWGYIGDEYAEERLKSEFFDPAVKALKEAA